MYILKLAWKNVWRNKLRSGVVIVAIIIGVWAGVFLSGFSYGMTEQYVVDQLNSFTPHLSVEHINFDEEKKPVYHLTNADQLTAVIAKNRRVVASSQSAFTVGLASSSANSFGVSIHGIDPVTFHNVFDIGGHLIDGRFLESTDRNRVVVGETLAERLNLRLNSKVVLTFQDLNGDITGAAFKVSGIFKTVNNAFDKSNLYLLNRDLSRLLGAEKVVHRIDIKTTDFSHVDTIAESLELNDPEATFVAWTDRAPELEYAHNATSTTLYIFMGIIILALALGILNMMLMAVLERTKELGMLMAVGMRPYLLFRMIILETMMLALVSTPVAIVGSWVHLSWVSRSGIDLSMWSDGMRAYGISPVIYPMIPDHYYVNIVLMVIAATLVAAIIPALKSIRLNPVESIRKQ